MNYEQIISKSLIALAIIITGLIISGSIKDYLKQKALIEQKSMINEGIFQCGEISSAQWEMTDGTQVNEPYKPVYEQCLKDKGIEIQRPITVTDSGETDEK